MTRRIPDAEVVASVSALARQLRRTPLAKDWKAHGCRPCVTTLRQRFGAWDALLRAAGLPPVALAPGWGAPMGHRVYWTDARVLEALRLFRRTARLVPPPRAYAAAVRGDRRFPTEARVRRAGGGSWPAAWLRAGVRDAPRRYARWTAAEEEQLLTLAGKYSLAQIARRLHRTPGACRRRLADLGTRARDAQGYLTGQACAREYGVPLHRVLDLCRRGLLDAHKGPGGVYWQIDPAAAAASVELRRPKQTHRGVPPDVGDYRERYGLHRPWTPSAVGPDAGGAA